MALPAVTPETFEQIKTSITETDLKNNVHAIENLYNQLLSVSDYLLSLDTANSDMIDEIIPDAYQHGGTSGNTVFDYGPKQVIYPLGWLSIDLTLARTATGLEFPSPEELERRLNALEPEEITTADHMSNFTGGYYEIAATGVDLRAPFNQLEAEKSLQDGLVLSHAGLAKLHTGRLQAGLKFQPISRNYNARINLSATLQNYGRGLIAMTTGSISRTEFPDFN